MKSLIVLLLVPVMAPAQLTVHLSQRQVTVAPNAAPREFTVACPAGQRVLSGGYADASQLRVTASYPRASGWSVRVHNPTKTGRSLQLSVTCAEVASVVKSGPGTSIRCPGGTVATGGGYLSAWQPRQGGTAITGSYPATPEGWAIDTVPPRAGPDARPGSEITVYAVCAQGVVAQAEPASLNLEPGIPQCSGGDVTSSAPLCTWPRSGSGGASCEGVLVGGGYQVGNGGRLPGDSVFTAAVSNGRWHVGVDGRNDYNGPLVLRLTAICAAFPVPTPAVAASAPAGRGMDLTSGQGVLLPIAFVAGILLLLALILVTRRRSRRPTGHGHVSVVLRANRGTFRLEELREVQ